MLKKVTFEIQIDSISCNATEFIVADPDRAWIRFDLALLEPDPDPYRQCYNFIKHQPAGFGEYVF
jgi:hypothetical protein